jgi:hypothetical protein
MSDKTPNDKTVDSVDDPPGGHDPAALEDAKEKMGVSKAPADATPDPGPPGGHDPAALEDARRKMGAP